MPNKPADASVDSNLLAPLTWAALLGLVTACAACSTGGTCNTDELPPTDPCYQKNCCDLVHIGADGGVVEDAGPGTTTRLCGACNG